MIRRHFPGVALSLAICLLLGTSGIAQRGTARPSKGGVDHKATQVRPIQLGTSGGNANDSANGYCCSGTLGALVTNGTAQFILSNTHVFAGDSVPGGNGTTSQPGDPVNQAGLIDVGCRRIEADFVGTVTDWARFGVDNVDASIARVTAGKVNPNGAILEIGTISSTTAAAVVGQTVKKSGRTTGLTRSSVSGLNATINVGYSDECAGQSFTAQFTGQILISNRGSRFLAGGDSGSLMVEDVATNPRAVGLLYAGSSSIAIANPIGDVLDRFNVTMVGEPSTVGAAATTNADATRAGRAQAAGLARAIEVQGRHGRDLLNVPGAIGHAVGMGNSPLIKILVEEITPGAQAAAPRELEGVPVILEEVGQVRALLACAKKK